MLLTSLNQKLIKEMIIKRSNYNHKVPVKNWTHRSVSYPFKKSASVSRSVMSNSATPWIVARQALLSIGFSRQEYLSGLPFLSPGDPPDPGIKPDSSTLQADSLPSEPPGKPQWRTSNQVSSPIHWLFLQGSEKGPLLWTRSRDNWEFCEALMSTAGRSWLCSHFQQPPRADMSHCQPWVSQPGASQPRQGPHASPQLPRTLGELLIRCLVSWPGYRFEPSAYWSHPSEHIGF